jgi:hypothetical protein
MARWWHGRQHEDGFRRRLQIGGRRGSPWMTDCLVGKPGRRRGRSVRTRVALAAGRGLEAAFVTPMARLPDAVLILLGVLTTFAGKPASALAICGQTFRA